LEALHPQNFVVLRSIAALGGPKAPHYIFKQPLTEHDGTT
jgi:hypothetical protein